MKHGASRLLLWAAVALASAALAPRVEPLDDTLAGTDDALATGVVAGGALFAALARRRFPLAALTRAPRRRLVARSTILAVKSAQEEALWRAVVLGHLAIVLGRAGALAASTALFAAAHVRRQQARAVVHLATGQHSAPSTSRRADSSPRSRHTVPTTCSSAQPPSPNETCPLRTMVGDGAGS